MLYAKSHKIIISGSRRRSEIFSYRADNIETFPLGQLYLLGEISLKLKSQNTTFLLNAIAATLKKTYYQHPQQGPAQRLEHALRVLNYNVPRLINDTNLEHLNKCLHLVVLVVSPTHLYFSKTPGPGIFLLRQGAWLNIASTRQKNGQSSKIFSQIIQGALQKDDQIFATSPSVVSYMHQHTFRAHLIENQLKNAQNQLERLLRSTDPQGAAALLRLIIQKEPTSKAKLRTVPLQTTTTRVHQTALTQEPSQAKANQGQQALFPNLSLEKPEDTLKTYVLKLANIFYHQQLPFWQKALSKSKNLLSKLTFSLAWLSRRSLYAIGVSILALILIATIVNFANPTPVPTKKTPLETLAKLPKTKIIKTIAPLIQFSQLGLEFDPFKSLLVQAENQPNLIVLGPATLYRLPLNSSSAGRFVFLPTSLIPAQFALPFDGQVLIINTKNGLSAQTFDPREEKFHPLSLEFNKTITQIRAFQKNLYFLTEDIEIYRKTNLPDTSPPTFWNQTDLTQRFSQAVDFEVNGSIWLLALDQGGRPVVAELKQGQLLETLDLTDLATVAFPDPSALRLTTSPESPDIHVLDPALGRIVVINKKTGTLRAQLLHPDLNGAKDFTLQASENRLLVLTPSAILAIPLP